jgi:glucuronoarabinoxylan endo-1,4-beta-xylanase
MNKLIVILAILTGLTISSCKKGDEITTNPFLSIEQSSLPLQELSADGGFVTLQVNWSENLWKVVAGDATEGVKFISGTTPDYGGSANKKDQSSDIKIYFRSNSNYTQNSQYIEVQSLDGSLVDKVLLTQKAKELQPIKLTINPTTANQTITGFGGANAIWGTDYLTTSEMDIAFGTGDNNLGMSIFRVRLSSNKNDWAGLVNTIKYANSLNVKVLASPWSPPAVWKSNNSVNGGGYLLAEYFDDFVAYINEFIQYMKDNSATVDAVSMQNEPDYTVTYEGCDYTKEEILNLVKNYAGNITEAKVVAAESFNFNHTFTDVILNDAVAVNNIDIVGGHIYGSGMASYPLAMNKGKEVWMTEHLLNLNSGNQPDNWTATTNPATIWTETMAMVDEIQKGMKNGWNAYIWWYIRRFYSFLGDGERGTQRGVVLKRGYAMAQFSKFIRPGYVRINASTDTETTGVTATAYKGNNQYIIVLSNTNKVSVGAISIAIPGTYSSVKSYTTSLSQSLNQKDLAVTNQNCIINLDAETVISVVIDL